MRSRFKLISSVILVIPLLIMQSCSKPGPDPFADNQYLLSGKLEFMRTKDNITSVIALAAAQDPALVTLIPDVQSGVNCYSIKYRTKFQGKDVVASGLVWIPSVPGDYPILSLQNGTNTLHSAAPSADPENLIFQLIGYMASAGYVVVMPDYLGFGASKNMLHPYLHKESTVITVIDMFRAVAEFDEDIAKDITISNECFLLGYSQGGWATLALLEELEQRHASEFTVKAAVCGAGPYDLLWFNNYVMGLENYPGTIFLGYLAHAYTTYELYPNPVTEIINETYAVKLPQLYNGTHDGGYISGQLTSSVSGFFTPGYLAGYATAPEYAGVRQALKDNSIKAWKSNVPLAFIHGTWDNIVMPAISENMHNDMVSAGSDPLNCLYFPLENLNHETAGAPAGLLAYQFFQSHR